MILLRPGLVPYGQALAWQLQLRQRLQEGRAHHPTGYLLCLEHPPVVTLGKRGRAEDIFGLDQLRDRGTQFFKIDRGGEATYHGPGQLVVYPVVRLDALGLGVVDLIRGLANSLSRALADFGLDADYDTDHPGLWTRTTPPRKIASVGMRVSGGVTTHGAAVNLINDLIPFSLFVPCGMPNAPVTRLLDHLDTPDGCNVEAFTERFLNHFAAFLDCQFEPLDLAPPPPEEAAPSMPL
ncbi:lipoyl(octanoyl) transferase [Lujinxingia litoralis]|uniref:Octanoyltransferase n=1 Tax=Lujinxingia litoralis TaxID=2211119 RepID=A0A328C0Z2_9DELT|nr:lipoyl(octanoyl) transferase LipB [Lujinxingia litoralis]RAL20063.1 lipoyl(octanoyl) transferase [Lujinxingia litoralis]